MIYILVFIISFALTYIIKNFYTRRLLFAKVNERSSHTENIPHGGGIALSIAWFTGITYLFISNSISEDFFYALLVGVIISLVSFFDDLVELSVKLRFIVQTIVAMIGLFLLGGLHSIDIGIYVITNQLITNIFAVLLIVWFINLTNFIDGINGYVGSEFVFLSLAGSIIFGGNHFIIMGMAVLGFLYWNWNKAKIFMGDVGSTLLGYNIAIFTLYYGNLDPENLWVWITLFSLFWFDATITLIRRKINGEKLSQAHKKHAYQRLTQVGWSHCKVTNYAIFINSIIFCLVILIKNILLACFCTLILLYTCLLYIDRKKAFI